MRPRADGTFPLQLRICQQMRRHLFRPDASSADSSELWLVHDSFFFFFHLKTGVSHTIRQIPGLSAQRQTTGTQTSSDNCGLDNKQPCVYLFYFRAAVGVCHMELHSSTNEMCVCVRFISVFTNEKTRITETIGDSRKFHLRTNRQCDSCKLKNLKNQDGERWE